MIELKERTLTGQDFDLSVLATLPRSQIDTITIESISRDFGCPSAHKVAAAIRRLSERGYGVCTASTRAGRSVWLYDPHGESREKAMKHMKGLWY